MKEFYISGYWKEDPEDTFEDELVTEAHDGRKDYFYYGMSESVIKDAIEKGINTVNDFVITSYREA